MMMRLRGHSEAMTGWCREFTTTFGERDRMTRRLLAILVLAVGSTSASMAQRAPAANNLIDQYNTVWKTQSENAGESMPCAGGDIGLNVWVENDDLLFYIGRAGCRDENGALLKLGRVRVKLIPNPFQSGAFRQELKLRQGHVLVGAKQADGSPVAIKIWVEVFRPVVHVDVDSESPVVVEATYESWRTETIGVFRLSCFK